jgi:hypothetical protein
MEVNGKALNLFEFAHNEEVGASRRSTNLSLSHATLSHEAPSATKNDRILATNQSYTFAYD